MNRIRLLGVVGAALAVLGWPATAPAQRGGMICPYLASHQFSQQMHMQRQMQQQQMMMMHQQARAASMMQRQAQFMRQTMHNAPGLMQAQAKQARSFQARTNIGTRNSLTRNARETVARYDRTAALRVRTLTPFPVGRGPGVAPRQFFTREIVRRETFTDRFSSFRTTQSSTRLTHLRTLTNQKHEMARSTTVRPPSTSRTAEQRTMNQATRREDASRRNLVTVRRETAQTKVSTTSSYKFTASCAVCHAHQNQVPVRAPSAPKNPSLICIRLPGSAPLPTRTVNRPSQPSNPIPVLQRLAPQQVPVVRNLTRPPAPLPVMRPPPLPPLMVARAPAPPLLQFPVRTPGQPLAQPSLVRLPGRPQLPLGQGPSSGPGQFPALVQLPGSNPLRPSGPAWILARPLQPTASQDGPTSPGEQASPGNAPPLVVTAQPPPLKPLDGLVSAKPGLIPIEGPSLAGPAPETVAPPSPEDALNAPPLPPLAHVSPFRLTLQPISDDLDTTEDDASGGRPSPLDTVMLPPPLPPLSDVVAR